MFDPGSLQLVKAKVYLGLYAIDYYSWYKTSIKFPHDENEIGWRHLSYRRMATVVS